MKYFDRTHDGVQELAPEDRAYRGSRYAEVREALYRNAYYVTWGAPEEPPLPVYYASLKRALRGSLPFFKPWQFLSASRRAVDARSDLRWGPERRGFRRIVHPNGVCLFGTWEIDAEPEGASYSGYFKKGSKALFIGRYSACCTETRNGRPRSLSMVGKIYPTLDPNHPAPLQTANFITQQDFGGETIHTIDDAKLRNAPDTTPWRRGRELPVLLVTGIVLSIADQQPTIRQLYPIAELGKRVDEPTRAPEFLQLLALPREGGSVAKDVDFRDEVLGRIYDRGDAKPKRALTFEIQVCDEGKTKGKLVQRRTFGPWHAIGRIVCTEAVASYNGDFVLHFQHPRWRRDRNDPASVARPPKR